MGAVTVATSMAGRGTDIKLGDDVRKLGGLAVIGIGRMANIRQERQARGRAGRQGDPGFSQFYVSLEDEVVEKIGESYIEKYVEGKKRIRDRKLRKVINSSQSIGEEFAIQSRKQAMEYDRVLENQRNLIYDMRDALLDGDGIAKETLMKITKENICDFLRKYKNRICRPSTGIFWTICHIIWKRMLPLEVNEWLKNIYCIVWNKGMMCRKKN